MKEFLKLPPAWEFYDLENDPNEMRNLYGNPEYQSIIDEMKIQLKETRETLKETDENDAINRIIDDNWNLQEKDPAGKRRLGRSDPHAPRFIKI